jgi:2-succinyl-6-hydroxy-2,4-cyclohexadiene-1-carboxylate synthase
MPLPLHWFRKPHPAARPLVLIHGFTGAAASWLPVIQALPADRMAAAIALPGHHPDADVADGFAPNADRLADAIERAGLAGGHVVGYSMGARLALGATVRHPDIASALTLIGVHHGLATQAERDARIAADSRWRAMLTDDGVEAFASAWEALPLFATQRRLSAERRAAQRQLRLAHDPRGLADALAHIGLGAMPDYGPGLAALARDGLPVHLIAGALDAKFASLARAAHARTPALTVTLVDGAGHNVPLERPEAIAALLAPNASPVERPSEPTPEPTPEPARQPLGDDS